MNIYAYLAKRKSQIHVKQEHKTQDFIPRFDHHKGVLLPVEEPTKGRVFSNPNPPQPDHQGQGILFSNLLTRAGNTNFLGSSTTLETPKQLQSV
jgi:hypothetical protein